MMNPTVDVCMWDVPMAAAPWKAMAKRSQRDDDVMFQFVSPRLNAIPYPKSPGPVIAVDIVPMESVAPTNRDVVEAAQAQLEDTLPPLHFFAPADAISTAFAEAYNGKGLDKLTLWLTRSVLDTRASAALVSEAVEAGLMATFQYVRQPGQGRVQLRQNGEIVLKQAIMRRLPKVDQETKAALADALVKQVKGDLAFGRKLLIDEATVGVENGSLYAQVDRQHEDLPQPQREARELLAA